MYLATHTKYKDLDSVTYWFYSDFDRMLATIDNDVDFVCERGVVDYTFGIAYDFFGGYGQQVTLLRYEYIMQNGETILKSYSVHTDRFDEFCNDDLTIQLIGEMNPSMPIETE